MKKFSYLAAALMLCAFASTAMATSFSAALSGAAEVPGPGDEDGSGIATITIEGTSIHYTILVANIDLSSLAAHIHSGVAGTAGDVLINLNPTFIGGSAAGSVSIDPNTAAELLSNPAGFYVNVHNSEFADGALRGQLTGAGTTTYFPVAGNVAGANNTKFVTDMRILNTGDETAQITVEFIQSSETGASGPTASRTTSVAAGGLLVLDNVTEDFIDAPGVLGALRVIADKDVRVDVRVINDQRAVSAGTTGFSIEGLGFDGAATEGSLTFLSQVSGGDFRTNIGHFNPNGFPIQVTFTAWGEDGKMLGTVTADVPAYRQLQLPVTALLPAVDGQADFYVTYSSTAPVFVYGAIVDNVNGDSVYVK